MVEIREETSDSESHNTNAQGPAASNSSSTTVSKSIVEFAKQNLSEVFSYILRLATIYMGVCYILPFFSAYFQKTCYEKAFIAAAATNAFRLHQRMHANSNPFFSRQFFTELFIEDSAHYLCYCFIFISASPVTMAILPITLYAFLHGINFVIKCANEVGYSNSTFVIKASHFKTLHTGNLLSMIACAEVFVFPIVVVMVFMGKASLFVPFLYYRFLTFRYLSRRNPYTRATFSQMKSSLYEITRHNSCPQFLRNIIFKCVSLVERLAPLTAY